MTVVTGTVSERTRRSAAKRASLLGSVGLIDGAVDGARHVAIRSTGAGSRCAHDGMTVLTGTVSERTRTFTCASVQECLLRRPHLTELRAVSGAPQDRVVQRRQVKYST